MDEDPFDAIARKNGWLPLTEGKAMTVRFGKRRYHVKRLTDQWPCDVPTESAEEEFRSHLSHERGQESDRL